MRSPRFRRSASSASAPSAAARRRASARPSDHPALLAVVALATALAAFVLGCGSEEEADGGGSPDRFDSEAASALIEEQVAVGQRPAGSPQLRKLAERLKGELP